MDVTSAQDMEFDQFFDLNGAADETQSRQGSDLAHTSSQALRVRPTRPAPPISPLSTVNSDFSPSQNICHFHTAPPVTDLPTPSHSSSSPDTSHHNAYRSSGDTLREDDPSIHRLQTLKRKLSPNATIERDPRPVPGGRPSGSKRPHNVIEKRYRANLNDKISELRDSVPSLRTTKKSKGKVGDDASDSDEDLDGLSPSNKLNKASILTKAVEYIRHLESRTKRLENENKALTDRLQILDKVIAKGGNDAERAAAFTSKTVIEPSPQTAASSAEEKATSIPSEAKGLIPLPEGFQQLRESQAQEHYGHVYTQRSSGSVLNGKWPTRIMLGTLAGLMVVDGISEADHGSESREKGLFGIPLEILDGWTFLRSPRLYLATFAEYCRTGGIVPLVKGFMALSILAFVVFVYMFNSKPVAEKPLERAEAGGSQSTRPASPRQVRRRAWSTSMQALHLPHHSFFPEWLAVTSEWINYTARYLVGPDIYAWLTGRTTEDETARVKAWDIAIDAQLAGGDTEVSRSRVVLTIFGSGTLPRSPLRLMSKAIHVRTVMWNMGLPDTMTAKLANSLAVYLANRQWRHARQLHERLSSRDADRLPGYLNYLLQMDCDEVFSDVVTQRAYNLMYDRPTNEYADDPLMDVVVDDHAVRSPIDAIAAWRSTAALHEALGAAIQSPDASDLLREHIQAALEIAPPGSAAETRALAVHAVLSPGRRQRFYERAVEAMTPQMRSPRATNRAGVLPPSLDEAVPYFVDSSTPLLARPEIGVCLACAQVMLKLEQDRDVARALAAITEISLPEEPAGMTMLGAAPLYFALWRVTRAARGGATPPTSNVASPSNPNLSLTTCSFAAQELFKFFRSEAARFRTTDSNVSHHLSPALNFLFATWDMRNVSASRRQSSVSNDTGYASLEEDPESDHHHHQAVKEVRGGVAGNGNDDDNNNNEHNDRNARRAGHHPDVSKPGQEQDRHGNGNRDRGGNEHGNGQTNCATAYHVVRSDTHKTATTAPSIMAASV